MVEQICRGDFWGRICLIAVCLPRSEARHGDGCAQAIVQVIEGALVGQQEGKAIGKGCKSEKKKCMRNMSNAMEG